MIIYLARCTVNGKCYIGLTGRTLAVRQAEHKQDARLGSKQPFHAAIRKHGWDQFEWTIVGSSSSKSELQILEQEMIAVQRPAYNVHPGGAGCPVGTKRREDTIAKMKVAQNNRSAEWQDKLRIPCSEEKRAKLKGRKRSPEVVERMRQAQRLRRRREVLATGSTASFPAPSEER